ncbi:F0F1 ATP synthase subunit delta [Candidatus Microgenomates bacterium]|nr:F0F1 ATP synthase subunit delta [Candidatus Microgenomates bacterium]
MKNSNESNKENGDATEEIVVTSAMALSAQQLSQIKKIIPVEIASTLPMVNKVNKKILAGFIIEVGDWSLDASLNYELKELIAYAKSQ